MPQVPAPGQKITFGASTGYVQSVSIRQEGEEAIRDQSGAVVAIRVPIMSRVTIEMLVPAGASMLDFLSRPDVKREIATKLEFQRKITIKPK